MTQISPHRGSFPLLRLALVAGAAIGLSGGASRHAVAEPPSEDELPSLMWQLSLLSPDELADLMDDPPEAAAPAPTPTPVPKAADAAAYPERDALGRVIKPDEPTPLAFKNVSVEQVVPFIVEATGKVVLPMPDVLSLRITVLNDQKIPRAKALDMVFLALFLNGVAVIENNDRITLRSIAEIDRGDIPVAVSREDLMMRSPGTIVRRVFALKYSSATNIAEMFKTSLPSFAKLTFDPDSNQVVVTADVGLLQSMQQTIDALDQQSTAALSTETFHLTNSDSDVIAQNIRDLYSPTAQTQNRPGQNAFQQFFQQRQGGRGGAAAATPQRGTPTDAATSQNLRVTSNTQQNAVTVLAEKPVLEQIRKQIIEEWDKPPEAIVPRVYSLKNSDPVKMRDVLISMFGSPGAQRQGNQATAQTANRLYGQFSFEAIPEAARLVVVAKNKANLEAIDQIIQDLDKPMTAGLPQIIELKHADAEQLAEQLNALLAREGTLAQVTKAQTGLTSAETGASPFATNASTATSAATQQNQANLTWPLWWARSQVSTTTAGSGNLVGKIRIVPVWRQNSLMVLSPPEYQGALRQIIETLDNPGRQVLLSAVIAEINVEDATALGLRWASSAITPTKTDNAISFGPSAAGTTAGGTITGQKNDLLPGLFDTSVLNLGVNLNAVIQALGEKTAINILSEPRIFTSDNQQAEFFSGQDIPFITQSQPATGTTVLVQNFDYKAVGIALRVRPRITINRDVDININLQLASTQPGNTLFGGAIVDRRETTTHLIVKDGQTVVVSGILRTEDNDTHRKVPGLGDLPLVGPLFNSIERTKKKTELIAFVTPYVVSDQSEIHNVEDSDRERLNTVRERLRSVNQLDFDPKKPAPPPRAPGEQAPVPPVDSKQ
jgi:type II secretion system protein D